MVYWVMNLSPRRAETIRAAGIDAVHWSDVGSASAEDEVILAWAIEHGHIVIYVANLFGSPPPNVTALACVGQVQWLLVVWGYWVDRHRRVVVPGSL